VAAKSGYLPHGDIGQVSAAARPDPEGTLTL
jgi:hypothetical protein